jgi:prolyl-tRNA synthetase
LPVIAVKSDVGMMGGKLAHEYMYLTPIGEDTLLLCDACGYSANRQISRFGKQTNPQESPLPIEKVATPDTKTIADLANYLGVEKSRTAKAVFLMADISEGQESVEKLVFAVVRGDMEVNETKLANALNAKSLRPATEAEIIACGAVPGYASPMGLKGALVIVDDAIPASPNLVAGANEVGYHLRNVNYSRDYQADNVTIAAAQMAMPVQYGSRCIPWQASKWATSSSWTRYSDAMGCTFLDHGAAQIGHHGILWHWQGAAGVYCRGAPDEHGPVWPVSVAPTRAPGCFGWRMQRPSSRPTSLCKPRD